MGLFRRHILANNIDYSTTVLVQNNTRWIVAQRDSISISVSTGLLEVSLDNSETFPNSLAWTEADIVGQAWIHPNGNISIMTRDNKIYLTDYNLLSISEVTVYDTDGVTPYIPHTPINPLYAGFYYYTSSHQSNHDESGMHVFINYSNAYSSGGTPIHVVYSTNNGESYKIAFKFGQNSRYFDDGTATGGTTGTPLGDPLQTIACKHGHSIIYCPYNGKWLCFTGDKKWTTSTPYIQEVRWLWLTYNEGTDTWSVEDIVFNTTPTESTRLKTDDGFFVGEYLVYGSDYTAGTDINETGVFRVHIDDIPDISKHQQLIPLQSAADQIVDMDYDKNTGYMVATVAEGVFPYNNYSLIAAKNYGSGEYSFYNFNEKVIFRIHSPNEKGFFRMDSNTTAFSSLMGECILLKIGDNLFNNL